MLIPSPPEVAPSVKGIDKIEHMAVFLILSSLLFYYLASGRNSRGKAFIITASILVIYGASIEFLQSFTGRMPEWTDLFADFTGIAAGGIVALFFL